jgi:hypothetical protein
MCFSATASFVTVGTTTAVAIACLTKVRQARELPLEDPDGPVASLLTLLFLLYAKVLWPAFAPMTVLLVEPSVMVAPIVALDWTIGVVVE